ERERGPAGVRAARAGARDARTRAGRTAPARGNVLPGAKLRPRVPGARPGDGAVPEQPCRAARAVPCRRDRGRTGKPAAGAGVLPARDLRVPEVGGSGPGEREAAADVRPLTRARLAAEVSGDPMRCPYCEGTEDRVVDSRTS